jgi:hypothetical protein
VGAGHLVAASVALDGGMALRALLDAVDNFLEIAAILYIHPIKELLARLALVVLMAAAGADILFALGVDAFMEHDLVLPVHQSLELSALAFQHLVAIVGARLLHGFKDLVSLLVGDCLRIDAALHLKMLPDLLAQ